MRRADPPFYPLVVLVQSFLSIDQVSLYDMFEDLPLYFLRRLVILVEQVRENLAYQSSQLPLIPSTLRQTGKGGSRSRGPDRPIRLVRVHPSFGDGNLA